MGQEEGGLQGTFPVISTLTSKYVYIALTSKGRSPENKLLYLLILSKLPLPPLTPQFGQLVQLFLNAQNVNLSDIQYEKVPQN